jgi:hypothetical protein
MPAAAAPVVGWHCTFDFLEYSYVTHDVRKMVCFHREDHMYVCRY